MKRILLVLALILAVCAPVHALSKKQTKALYNEVKGVIETQLKYTNTNDIDGLSKLYSPDFVNNDGFNKDVYFKLVKETMETYPNISYTAEIKNIYLNEKYAKVEVYETASATTKDADLTVAAFGELFSVANSIYYMEKNADEWLITAEYVVDEKSVLRYGQARYIKLDLFAPTLVGAGNYYTASLKVDAPENVAIIASIGNAKSAYPQAKPEDKFRQMPEDNVLERIFLANKSSINEYAVASVGVAKPEYDKKVIMGGLAFIMTRINVVPENKFTEKNAQAK